MGCGCHWGKTKVWPHLQGLSRRLSTAPPARTLEDAAERRQARTTISISSESSETAREKWLFHSFPFIHPLSHLSTINCSDPASVPGTVLGSGDIAVRKTERGSVLTEPAFW